MRVSDSCSEPLSHPGRQSTKGGVITKRAGAIKGLYRHYIPQRDEDQPPKWQRDREPTKSLPHSCTTLCSAVFFFFFFSSTGSEKTYLRCLCVDLDALLWSVGLCDGDGGRAIVLILSSLFPVSEFPVSHYSIITIPETDLLFT